MDKSSGVGVVDKTVAVLQAVSTAPRSLADLVLATGLTRPTAHRLALALEHHHLVGRDETGRFVLGPQAMAWAASADGLPARAASVVADLRDATGLSAQVYRRMGDQRLCLAAAEPATGLRDTVPVGALLTLQAGSAAQILVAWLPVDERERLVRGAAFDEVQLARVRRRGYAHSLGQREPGVGSLSVPARDEQGLVTAAVSISGPQERLSRPSASHRALLLQAAERLTGTP
ncbi:MAG TPA: IclR family transcriptional regulator [Actinobacteria bacterium]|nr:IclR family transcriptional regulator [Actinomycetota bacterium]